MPAASRRKRGASLSADTFTFNGAETVNASESVRICADDGQQRHHVGTGGILRDPNLTINEDNFRIGAITVPLTPLTATDAGLLVTAGSITVASDYNVGTATLKFDTTTNGGSSSGAVNINTRSKPVR